MKKKSALTLALISLLIFSCQEQPTVAADDIPEVNNEPQLADSSATSAQTDPVQIRPVKYHDFHLEKNVLRNGYQFGMLLSEWNKHLASLAEKGIAKELSKVEVAYGQDKYLTIGSYRAFFPVDTSMGIQSSRQGFFISGLFASPKSYGDTVEVFRINGQETDQPVLIGIQVDCAIPDYRINEAIQAMVDKDELERLAGGRLPYATNAPLEVSDFDDAVSASLAELDEKLGKKNNDDKRVQTGLTDRSLLQCPRFYAVIELYEQRSADVVRGTDYRVRYISNAYRTYHLVQRIYSKTQSNLNIEEYMTVDELENYKNASETRKLIEQAKQ